MKTFRALAATLGVALGLGAWGLGVAPVAADSGHRNSHASEARAKPTPDEFNQAVRKLWEDHVTWTRLFIVSASADLPDLDATTNRLLENQQDIGDAIKPFYGDDAGEQLTALLREHILVAADILTAAKAGDQAAVEAASEKWYANSDEIAAFLSDANPENWARADTKAMMREHLDLTLEEAVAHLEGRYDDDVAAYDKVHDAILHMADALSDGIVEQFPKRFAG
jgi:hypothetical protein